MSKFKRVKKLSVWRKLALVTWSPPGDPSVYGQFEFDATNAIQFIADYNKKHNSKVTITHFAAKAVGLTIAKYPGINGLIKWGQLYARDSVDIFLQVAIPFKNDDTKENLSGAKINKIDKKPLREIVNELGDQVHDIRDDRDPQFQKTFDMAKRIPVWLLKPLVRIHEFLVYNLNINAPSLGMVPDPFGSAMVTSVGSLGIPPGLAPLVPPSRCPIVICVGKAEDKAWVVDGKIEIRPIISYTATFDHRFMDGLVGSRMFKRFMEVLENPAEHMDASQ
jgi:pyruvate/2-oxoglutarate dehydrogenase complex dihydrolipoamide acyltransferase (E2) component